jgi:hypothetical protein
VNRLHQQLRLIPHVPDDIPEEDQEMPVPQSAPQAALAPLPGGQVSARDQVAAAVGHGFRQAWRQYRAMARRDGGLIKGLRAAKPPSIDEHFEYGTSRVWVPSGHQGGSADRLGVFHNRTVGALLVLGGLWLIATGHKPLRCYLTFTVLYALAVIFLWAAGAHGIAVVMLLALAGVIAAVLGLEKVTRPRKEED